MQKNNHIARLFLATQRSLSSPNLDPNSIKIDSRSTQQLLSFLAKLAKQFWYYNENGYRDGDWSNFFETDQSSLLALISEAYDENDYRNQLAFIDAIEKISKRDNHKLSDELSESLLELFHHSFKPVFKINDWYKTFTRFYVDSSFHLYLKEFIWRKLNFGLRDLYAFYYFSVQSGIINDKEKVDDVFKKFQDLDVIWNFNPFPNIARSKVDTYSFLANPTSYLSGLREAIKNLHNHEKAISSEAKISFSNSLNTGKTEPHIALILGFLRAYSFQQDAINQLLPKHLNFYYKDVLDFEKRGAVGDDVFLMMKLNKEAKITDLPKLTSIIGGTDKSGSPILFKTTNKLQVTHSTVSDYQTLILNHSNSAGNVLQTFQIKGFDKPVINKESGRVESFKMFGEASDNHGVHINSNLGFAISSPEFFLEGGKRCIEIKFENSSTSSKTGDEKTVLLNDLVDLKITGTKGWFTPDYEEIKLINGSLRIRFGLKKSSSAVANYSSKLHGKGYDASWPLVVISLSNNVDPKGLNPYQVFSKISFSSYSIKTTTKGLGILSLVTHAGKASSTATIAPFGGTPTLGSQLIIGCYEAFIKHTRLLNLKVNWLNLPKFWEYYFAYNQYQTEQDEDPTFFKTNYTGELSWLNFGTGKWDIVNPQAKLFESDDSESTFKTKCGHPCTSTKEDVKSDKQTKNTATKSPLTEVVYPFEVSVKPNYSMEYPLIYTDKSKSGFLSLELTGPDETFGANLYPKIVSETTLQNTIKAAKKARKKKTDSSGNNAAPSSKVVKKKSSKSGISKWFGNIFRKIGGFFSKIFGPVLKKLGPITKWINENIIKKVSPLGSWIAKILGAFLKYLQSKKKKKAAEFKPLPNKPFIPKIKGVTVDYCSSCEIKSGTDSENKLFRIHPFGIKQFDNTDNHLLPQFKNYGYAFLGFEKLEQGATLSIFLAVEDLKKTVITEEVEEVNVEVLSNHNWENLRLLSDTTLGLKKAGILRVLIDKAPDNANPIMPLNKYWIRLSTSGTSVTTVKLKMIGTNAVLASRAIIKENSSYDIKNLKAGSITKLETPIPAIASISQPFSSFGGGDPENDERFNQRIARRLSNKGRGISMTYIESIVLDAFPQIYQLNIHQVKKNRGSDPNLRIGILPQVMDATQHDPYHPVAPVSLLNEVKVLLQDKVSPHVNLEIEHMKFDKIHVSLDVDFKDLNDGKSLKDELNADIKDFLSPWIIDNSLAHSGQKLYVNDLLKFIRARAYVLTFDNVKIELNKEPIYGSFKGKGNTKQFQSHQIIPTSSLRTLSSTDQHSITVVTSSKSKPGELHQIEPEPIIA